MPHPAFQLPASRYLAATDGVTNQTLLTGSPGFPRPTAGAIQGIPISVADKRVGHRVPRNKPVVGDLGAITIEVSTSAHSAS
jgi:hypothetical protein